MKLNDTKGKQCTPSTRALNKSCPSIPEYNITDRQHLKTAGTQEDSSGNSEYGYLSTTHVTCGSSDSYLHKTTCHGANEKARDFVYCTSWNYFVPFRCSDPRCFASWFDWSQSDKVLQPNTFFFFFFFPQELSPYTRWWTSNFIRSPGKV